MKVIKFFAAAVSVMAMVACTRNKKETAMTNREPANIMVVVDLQKDFIDGNLPATDGTRVVEPVKSVLPKFDKVYFTLDWHPWNHCSFKANGGIWPQHCVRYTVGAALPDGILDNLVVGYGMRHALLIVSEHKRAAASSGRHSRCHTATSPAIISSVSCNPSATCLSHRLPEMEGTNAA